MLVGVTTLLFSCTQKIQNFIILLLSECHQLSTVDFNHWKVIAQKRTVSLENSALMKIDVIKSLESGAPEGGQRGAMATPDFAHREQMFLETHFQ